jgi:hypothetical protein
MEERCGILYGIGHIRPHRILKMKITVEILNAIVTKVSAATGKEDLMKVQFNQTKNKEGAAVNVVCFQSYGAGLQITQNYVYPGTAEPDACYIVKSSQLQGIIKSYIGLGVTEVDIEGTENQLVIRNGNGSAGLARAESMSQIDMREAQADPLCAISFNLKEMQGALKSVSYAVGASTEQTNGVQFCATESGYLLYATNTYVGAQSSVKAAFKAMTKEEFSKDFFVGNGFLKAINALKGETLSMMLTKKYLILKDVESTFAIVALNETKFPVSAMTKVMVNDGVAVAAPESFVIEVTKEKLEAAIGLAEVLSTESIKSILLQKLEMGENIQLLTGSKANPQAIDAKVTTVGEGDSIMLQTTLLRGVLTNISANTVKIRVLSNMCLFYGEGSVMCSAFLMGRKPSAPAAKAETKTAEKSEGEAEA